MSVVFPDPLGPSMPMNSSSPMANAMLERTTRVPKASVTPLSSMALTGGFDNAMETALTSPIIQSWYVVPAGSVSVTPTTGTFACWAIRTMRCAAASLA